MWHLYISCVLASGYKRLKDELKSLQGKQLILISVILDCSRENALNVIIHNLTIGPPGMVARAKLNGWYKDSYFCYNQSNQCVYRGRTKMIC